MPPKKRGPTAEDIKAKNIAETKAQLLKLYNIKMQLVSEQAALSQQISADENELDSIKSRTKGNSLIRIENEISDAEAMINKNKKGTKPHEEAKKCLNKLNRLKIDILRRDSIEIELPSKRTALGNKKAENEAAEQKYSDFAETKAKGLKISIDDVDAVLETSREACIA